MQESSLILSFDFRYVKPPIFTLCVGNAWGEAALLLTAGAKGNRSALPSSTIMIKQVIPNLFLLDSNWRRFFPDLKQVRLNDSYAPVTHLFIFFCLMTL